MMRKTGESEDEFVVNEADEMNDDGDKDSDSGKYNVSILLNLQSNVIFKFFKILSFLSFENNNSICDCFRRRLYSQEGRSKVETQITEGKKAAKQ